MAFERATAQVPQLCGQDNEQKRVFFEEMFDYWYPPSDAIEKNFTKHTAAYDALVREMRSDDDLRVLEPLMYPIQAGGAPLRLNLTGKQQEKSFLFFVSLIQVMENVYLDLDLENNADHPHNAGWVQIFQMWAQAKPFKDAWDRSGWTFGRNFRCFCARHFGLR
jgi:hypothetical protein